jgi:hypothetical protein
MTAVVLVDRHTAAERPLRGVHESVSSPVLRVQSIPILKIEPELHLRLGNSKYLVTNIVETQ